MNTSFGVLNAFAPWLFKSFVWPMLWQSSLLIGLVFGLDLALRRKLRASVRYALWLVVLVKLLLPPSLALPTGLGWWVRPSALLPAVVGVPGPVVVTFGPAMAPVRSTTQVAALPIPQPCGTVALGVWAILVWSGVSFGFLAFMLFRWRQVTQSVNHSSSAEESLLESLDEAERATGLRRPVQVRLISGSMSPAVCGLFRPVILLPESLARQLAPAQLRAVLLHELIHIRRGDVWVNCAQALLQIVYWWHPLLWLANARIPRVREEAVDDAVMLALRDDAETYAATLLEVAKLAFRRPLSALGLVGILESRTSLRQRIERLIDFHAPRKAGLTVVSALSVLAFGALALPMGEKPAQKKPPTATPPKSVWFSDTGGLLTHATPASIEEIGAAVQQVTTTPTPVEGQGLAATGASFAALPSRSSADALVREGRSLYEAGKLDQALKKLAQAVKESPGNQLGHHYLQLIAQTKYQEALARRLAPMAGIGTQIIPAEPGRQAIRDKLRTIRFDEVKYDGLALSDVIANLNEQAKSQDPEKKGIHFILDQVLHKNADGTVVESEVGRVSIRIMPPLKDVRLAEVLEAIVKVADRPIRYSVEGYGVVFSFEVPEPSPLYTRVFNVDTKTLLARLEKQNPGTNDELFHRWFESLGVDITPPKKFFFNYGEGSLFLRATLQDLDIIGQALQTLNAPPPQILIQGRFLEVSSETVEALSAAWKSRGVTNLGTSSDIRVLAPEHLAPTVSALEQTPGTYTLLASSVSTVDGRQAQITSTVSQTVTNQINPQALAYPGVSNESDIYIRSENVALGSVLDITPKVSKNAAGLEMTIVADVTKFLGYDTSSPTPVYINGERHSVSTPVGKFAGRQMTAAAAIPDGYTLVTVITNAYTLSAGHVVYESAKSKVIVLVTATIVDSTGNRVHANLQQAK